jgi:hypothetical protein
MTEEHLFELFLLIGGVLLTYTGCKNLFHRSFKETIDQSAKYGGRTYKDLPDWLRNYLFVTGGGGALLGGLVLLFAFFWIVFFH